jgi:microsomal epoxide hydrolase
VLRYDRYAASGCDVGALITGQLGHKYANDLYAIHIGSAQKLTLFNGDRAWNVGGGGPIPMPRSLSSGPGPGVAGRVGLVGVL